MARSRHPTPLPPPRLKRDVIAASGTEDDPLDANAWHREIDSARDPAQVVTVARRFIEAWPLEELDRLPYACQPPPLDVAEDVTTYAMRLAAFDRQITDRPSSELVRMATVMTFAATHLMRLRPPLQ
jgi:hypothetical protein